MKKENVKTQMINLMLTNIDNNQYLGRFAWWSVFVVWRKKNRPVLSHRTDFLTIYQRECVV
tara:strand:- start:261 stop:443 length:183 start_codon:yes stop_codon:yes gene_type:complete